MLTVGDVCLKNCREIDDGGKGGKGGKEETRVLLHVAFGTRVLMYVS